MDDISEKLGELLKDADAMQQIQELASMLGTPSAVSEENTKEKAESPLPKENGKISADKISPEMLQQVMQIMGMLSCTQQESNNTRFLSSLRPLLGKERQQKLDQSVQLLKLLDLLPLLKERGLL